MNESIALRLDLISSRAKILATDYRNRKLWEGEFNQGLTDIQQQLNALQQEAEEAHLR